jgi:hypothetical protein
MAMNIDAVIEAYVSRCNEEYERGLQLYDKYVRAMRDVDDLKHITTQDVIGIVRPFLFRWGRMGRVVGRQEFRGWEQKTTDLIKSNSEVLERLRRTDIVDTNVDSEDHIKSLYASFRKVLGPVGATKLLHLICPRFFPMWDNDIARAVRSELGRKSENNARVQDFSADDYHRFAKETRAFIIGHQEVLSDLSARLNRTKLKIVDDCFWWGVHRPLSAFFQER